ICLPSGDHTAAQPSASSCTNSVSGPSLLITHTPGFGLKRENTIRLARGEKLGRAPSPKTFGSPLSAFTTMIWESLLFSARADRQASNAINFPSLDQLGDRCGR